MLALNLRQSSCLTSSILELQVCHYIQQRSSTRSLPDPVLTKPGTWWAGLEWTLPDSQINTGCVAPTLPGARSVPPLTKDIWSVNQVQKVVILSVLGVLELSALMGSGQHIPEHLNVTQLLAQVGLPQ